MSKKDLKKFKPILSDKDAEKAMAEDLTEYDLAQFRPITFEFKAKDKAVSLRLSDSLLDAIKAKAAKEGLSYQRFMRRALEEAIARDMYQAQRDS